ncbi:MAG: cytochrome c [Flavobacteriales bacterium]|nr:cytochrome c [Flavobacteriales bacterium]
MKLVLVLIVSVFSVMQNLHVNIDNTKWKAPESVDKVANPIPVDIASISAGKQLFNKLCWTCHGQTGKGNGPASTNLNAKPTDFSSVEFNEQTDGAIFWKISEGRGSMASFKTSLSAKQRWQLVNYLRTLK